ncbi:MAG: Fe-S cluster assembly protein SufD [Zetaproteobacteria bacterium CG12_big_fil_rev_8_21_14_0_65_55_1124]|nr:MAG: Fe-S cluster assembly protein SufD [Zetaproteobacteria bacterium CG1_02_55_237]PIS20128.1 MAG: Fe-S cluster assembly protein SufD [Zetaproteobacteria bacterium CG08_land_8_20_14_0_20_55_17]PIW43191.1 MAG: Fe-S cluster assembly protein SufD [Zetaproteobacteria bacterium CG12_big_fil_rev_8_21_14_0_65_55_1124]PIY53185.1 MAG: Fe-S cluster assembly protein SufD [Zetaproteobacteria bacterium CG_4_10_14_0_8_um_filter_55_43]PIZ39697.1 MAG: Fe-S cluster assembly protein SufD [Zetaproteobacteria 
MPKLAEFRKGAWGAFEQAGLPTTRQEEWKYTSLARISSTLGETWWTAAEPTGLTTDDIDALAIPDLDAWRIVFADGRLVSSASSLPAGAALTPLSELLATNGEQAVKALAWDADAPLFNGALAANSALAEDGVCLCLADGVKLDKPIYVLHIASQSGASHLRHGLWLGKEACAHVIEHYAGVNEEPGLTHAVTLVHLGDAAQLTHDRLQDESLKQFHLGRLDVWQGRDSNFTSHAIALGASLARLDIAVDLAGPGAACKLDGLYMPTGRQHSDHHTQIDHRAPHCTSREHYRGVLDDRAHGVFNGKVVVHKGASGTDSAQKNANLLLSDKAEIDAKPELVIHHDDVKAAHGCTIGQLDDKQLFYLKSRGISAEEARQMLTFAFADEVLTGISLPALRRFIEKAAFSKLPFGTDAEAMLG